jgi:DNA primase
MMGVSDAALMPDVLAHYRLVAPLIDASLSQTPIVFVNYPNGVDKQRVFHVTTVPLSVDKLLWLMHAEYAIEFYTWAPTLLHVGALRFGRILLEAPQGVDFEKVKLAALAMRALLFDVAKLEAVPLLDGGKGIALWIPLADAPQAEPLRVWLHVLCKRAVALHPDLVSTAYNTLPDGRVHLHVESNASGHYSAVPYSLRAQRLTVCTPIHWGELGSFTGADAFRFDAIPARLQNSGDVFASEVEVIAGQAFRAVPST